MTPEVLAGHYNIYAGSIQDAYVHHGHGGSGHNQVGAGQQGGGGGSGSQHGHGTSGGGGGQGWQDDHLGAYYSGLDPKECVNCGTTKICNNFKWDKKKPASLSSWQKKIKCLFFL